MAKISVTPSKYPNIIVAYLFDKLLHPDRISIGNEEFDNVIQKMKQKGFMPILRDYYLSMDPVNRYEYKMIKRAFEGKGNARIEIEKEKEPEKPGLIKRLVKKIISSTEFTEKEKELLIEELDFKEEELNG